MAKENYSALIKNIDPQKLAITRDAIDLHSIDIDKMVNEVVYEYCSPLDKLMNEIYQLLNDSVRPTDEELDAWACKLAACLYFVGEGVEAIGVRQDISKAYKMDKYNRVYDDIETIGTISDKTAKAELESQEEYIVNSIYTRAYKKANQKLEAGNEMLSSIKKVISRRMSAFALSVKDKSEFI